jgi:hypothetical protein
MDARQSEATQPGKETSEGQRVTPDVCYKMQSEPKLYTYVYSHCRAHNLRVYRKHLKGFILGPNDFNYWLCVHQQA